MRIRAFAVCTLLALAATAPAAGQTVLPHSTLPHSALPHSTLPHSASAAYSSAYSSQPVSRLLPSGEAWVCPVPSRPGQMACMAIYSRAGARVSSAPGAADGYGPPDLRRAYGVVRAARTRGHGETIAIVDAGGDQRAAADLATYRRHYGLPACTLADKCLRIVNEHGQPAPLPPPAPGWYVEESIDLDMVSAMCPDCRIILVQARDDFISSMGIAEDTAAALGARFISNSWSGSEFFGQQAFDQYFNHPGRAVVAASGDYGYGPSFPGDIQYVTSVGGTTLRPARNRRGWSETAWGGTGSGCSSLEPKPSWQRYDATAPDGCLNRTQNDVAAVADPRTGVAVYASGWLQVGGTSVATPIITALYALAGTPPWGTYPASYPYLHPSGFQHITGGANGTCEPYRQYLCTAVAGYNGPAGVGSPNGLSGLAERRRHTITLVDPGTQDFGAGARISLLVRGLDSPGWGRLHYHASGLPSGVRIMTSTSPLDARISGRLPAVQRTYNIVVTTAEGTAQASTSFRIVAASPPAASPAAGPLQLASTGLCLHSSGTAGSPVQVQDCSTAQNWTWSPGAAPDSVGTVKLGALCLAFTHTGAGILTACRSAAADQQLSFQGFGQLQSPRTGMCFGVSAAARGSRAGLYPCTGAADQSWTMPAAPIAAGLAGLCAQSASQVGQQAAAAACSPRPSQQWTWLYTGQIELGATGRCLLTSSTLDQAAVRLAACNGSLTQTWTPGPGDQIINGDSGRCVADLQPTRVPAGLVQDDCYGRIGEVWTGL
jgi:hypothetical protein